KKTENKEIDNIAKNSLSSDFKSSIHSICNICNLEMIKRTKHCYECHKCVHKFDHHCKYLNTCVGGKNYKFFIIVIGCIFAISLFHIALIIFLFVNINNQNLVDRIDKSIFNKTAYFILLGLSVFPAFITLFGFGILS
ncbi:hypothetical protein MHBO_004909, partial [Bonamia ostreae]